MSGHRSSAAPGRQRWPDGGNHLAGDESLLGGELVDDGSTGWDRSGASRHAKAPDIATWAVAIPMFTRPEVVRAAGTLGRRGRPERRR
jgi:hypothetical protein